MGRLQAEAMAEASISLEAQLDWHLTSNHYPPVPSIMVPVCIEALDAVNTDSDWDRQIALPEGVSWRGLSEVSASVIIEQHHLDPWIIESELY